MILTIVNNIRITKNKEELKYKAVSPDKRVLEEFEKFDSAVKWASNRRDYVKKQLA